jgi:glycine C-acetyltransferase
VNTVLREQIGGELDDLREARTYKRFNVLGSMQGPVVRIAGRGEVVVLSSNNYLGLAAHPDVVRAGIEGLERYGAGTASVRFICGTFEPHHELERALAELSGTEAALSYVSCWNANEAVIPTLTDETTVIFTDELNHASIIDAVRLSRPAQKVIYPHSDMAMLRDALAAAPRRARKLIVTDGVFSMEGDLVKLPEIVESRARHEAVVIVDDSHGVGVLSQTGRVVEHFGLVGEVDVLTGTLGKALGGAAGLRRRVRGDLRPAGSTLASAALLERVAADRSLQRATCDRSDARPTGAARAVAREHRDLPGAAGRCGLQPARR